MTRTVASAGPTIRPVSPDRCTQPGTALPGRCANTARAAATGVGNAIFSVLAQIGIGPAHLLTTRGRKTGRLRTTPVILVVHGQQRWLVAPYGAVPWVLNARAAGRGADGERPAACAAPASSRVPASPRRRPAG